MKKFFTRGQQRRVRAKVVKPFREAVDAALMPKLDSRLAALKGSDQRATAAFCECCKDLRQM